jgi:hypothetical protein
LKCSFRRHCFRLNNFQACSSAVRVYPLQPPSRFWSTSLTC